MEGGKPKNPVKNSQRRDENQQQGIKPGIKPRPQWWEVGALTTVPSLHPQSFSSHPKANVSCLWHPGAATAQPYLLLYNFFNPYCLCP